MQKTMSYKEVTFSAMVKFGRVVGLGRSVRGVFIKYARFFVVNDVSKFEEIPCAIVEDDQHKLVIIPRENINWAVAE
jgi:hypothetical protein